MSAADRKDLPPVESSNFLARVREEISRLLGYRGDPMDRAVTLGDLSDAGLIDVSKVYTKYRHGTPITGPGPAVGSGDGAAYEPDLTPPPTPTGCVVTATFSSLILQTASPVYTQGHGHAKTRVRGAKYTGGPLPTFSDSVLIDEFSGNVDSYPTSLGVEWHLWFAWVSIDGVESTTWAGGTNGITGTTGLVGSSDLGNAIVLSQALAPGSVTADKAALDIGGSNLLANNSFEVDADANGVADGWGMYNNSIGLEPSTLSLVAGRISGYAQRITWAGTNTSTKGVATSSSGGGGIPGGWQAGKVYVVSFYARADTAKAVGMSLEWNTFPATTIAIVNPTLATTWQRYAFRITWGGSVEVDSRSYLSVVPGSAITGYIEFDDAQIEAGDTLTAYAGKLALNTIVAGDGAIANLAITNALIENLAVDDAKIASLTVAKLLAGSLAVGQYIQSTSFVSGTSGWRISADGTAEFAAASIRGQLVASQINANGLTIKTPAGSVVLDASGTGAALSWSLVGGTGKPADNATVGATFGTNISGQINSGNVSTYIAAAAIGSAYVGTLTAANLTVTALSNTVNGSTSSGQRVDIVSNGFEGYDVTNALRWQLGIF